MQNSLLELFGLVSFIDEYAFGDLKSFREQFANAASDRVFNLLRERLKPICHRTLRRQVTTYVPYTRRYPIVEEFAPEDGEDKLYDLVSEYLRRDNLQALPASQRSLMTLVLRKLLEFDFNRRPQPEARHEPLLTIAEACGVFNLKPQA